MKNLLRLCSFFALAGSLLAGCAESPNSSEETQFQMGNGKGGGGSTPAPDPVWVFSSHSVAKGKSMPSISVSDIDGTDRTAIYRSPVYNNRPLFATWSPDGGSVSFVDMPNIGSGGWYGGTTSGTYTLYAVDVDVTNSQVVPSNLRTIISYSQSQATKIVAQAWSPATSGDNVDQIAYTVYTSTESRIYTIPVSGGSPTLRYSIAHTDGRVQGNSLTWSSDGAQIAFAQITGINVLPNASEIRILNTNDNSVSTLMDGFVGISELQWSNSGTSQITFEGTPTTDVTISNKYVVATSGGSVPTMLVANDGGGYGMYWSPDNSEACYMSTNGNGYRYNFSTGVSTVTGAFPNGDWR